MDMPVVYTIIAQMDEQTGRWTATSEDIPGLVVEEGDFAALKRSVTELAPALLDLNDGERRKEIPVVLRAESSFYVQAAE